MRTGPLVAGMLCLMGGVDAFAEQGYPNVWINPGFYSWHFDRDANLREDNVGFGVEVVPSAEHALMAGSYANSDWARSHYVGYQWRPLHWSPGGLDIRGGVAIAAMDGYPRMRDGDWFPVVLPLIYVERNRLGINFTVVPTIEDRLNGAIAMQIKLRVW